MSGQKWVFQLSLYLLLAASFSGCLVLASTENSVAIYFNSITGDLRAVEGQYIYPYNPFFESVTVYQLGEQTYTMDGEDSIVALTRDGQQVTVSVTVHYRLNAEQSLALHRRWGDRFADQFIRPMMRSRMRDLVGALEAQALYNMPLESVSADFTPLLSAALVSEGLVLTQVEVTSVQFSQAFTQAMEARGTAEAQTTALSATSQAIIATSQAEAELTPTPAR